MVEEHAPQQDLLLCRNRRKFPNRVSLYLRALRLSEPLTGGSSLSGRDAEKVKSPPMGTASCPSRWVTCFESSNTWMLFTQKCTCIIDHMEIHGWRFKSPKNVDWSSRRENVSTHYLLRLHTHCTHDTDCLETLRQENQWARWGLFSARKCRDTSSSLVGV